MHFQQQSMKIKIFDGKQFKLLECWWNDENWILESCFFLRFVSLWWQRSELRKLCCFQVLPCPRMLAEILKKTNILYTLVSIFVFILFLNKMVFRISNWFKSCWMLYDSNQYLNKCFSADLLFIHSLKITNHQF